MLAMLALLFSTALQQPPFATRRTVLGASAAIATTSPRLARADTIQSICQKLDTDAPRNAQGHPAEQLEIVVGLPGFDAWCPVEVSAPLIAGADHIDYLWLKDARTETSQRIYAARSFAGDDARVPSLRQKLKKGYVFRPMAYCSGHGLWEGQPIKV